MGFMFVFEFYGNYPKHSSRSCVHLGQLKDVTHSSRSCTRTYLWPVYPIGFTTLFQKEYQLIELLYTIRLRSMCT